VLAAFYYQGNHYNNPEDSLLYYYGDKVQEDGLGGACSTNARDKKCI
jgi:hypothetical protein